MAGFAEAADKIDLDGDGRNATVEYMNGASTVKSMPVSFSAADFQPFTFSYVGNVDLNDVDEVWQGPVTRKQLKPGAFYATGTITVGNDGLRGQVTFVAEAIDYSGSGSVLSHFLKGLLFFATGSVNRVEALRVKGSDHSRTGLIFAPVGKVKLEASRLFIDGSVFTKELDWKGSDGRIAFNPALF